MSKILITGICGMVGAVISRYLLEKGHYVIGVDNLSEGYRENAPIGSNLYINDISNLNELNEIFTAQKPDYVVHLAAEAAEVLSPFIRSFTYKTNIVGTANVINCCINHDVKKILSFSSIARYGNGKPPFKEIDPINPLEPYAFSKVLNEWDLKEAYEHFGLKYNIITGFNIASKYQNFYSKYRNCLAIFVRQAILGENITVYGVGDCVRSFSDAQFICDPIEKLLFGELYVGENFNLGSEKPITVLEAAQLVQKIAIKRGFNPEIVHLEPRKEVKIAYCSTEKAQYLLEFKDNTDLELLLEEMFDYALTQPRREIKTREYEVERNIYSYWRK